MCLKQLLSCFFFSFCSQKNILFCIFFGNISEFFNHRGTPSWKVNAISDSESYENSSKKLFRMCVSTEESSQHLDVRGPEDGWVLEFRVWESSLTDTISAGSHIFINHSLKRVVGYLSPSGCWYCFTQVPSWTSQRVMLLVWSLNVISLLALQNQHDTLPAQQQPLWFFHRRMNHLPMNT